MRSVRGLGLLVVSWMLMPGSTARAQARPESASPIAASMRIAVQEDRVVPTAAPDRPHTEPMLSVNRRDPRQMVGIAMLASEPVFEPGQDCVIVSSFDAGASWSHRRLGTQTCVDPWIELLDDGSAVAAVLATSRLTVYRSPDGGRSWDQPVTMGAGHDHEVMTVDRSSGPLAGSVYVVSGRARRMAGVLQHGLFIARSGDGGRTFPDTVLHPLMNTNFNPDRAYVLSDGTLVISFTDGMRNVDGFRTDRGRLERARTWLVRSSDGGRTLSPPMLASEMCGRGGGFPTGAIDESAKAFRDRLYIICSSRARNELLVANSTTALDVWSDAVAVTGASDSLSRRTPQLAVSPSGVVGAAWYAQVPGMTPDCQRVMFAASSDGGKTFTQASAVSSEHFCVNTPGNGGAARRWPSGGEYFGLVAASDGSFRLLWSDARSGVYQLRTATVQVAVFGQ